jgi:hypothetical protein
MAFPPAQPNMWDAMGVEKRWEQDRAAAQVSRARQDAADAQTSALRLRAQQEQLHTQEKAQLQSQLQSNAEMHENFLRLNARAWEMVLREQLEELENYRVKDLKRPKKTPAEMEKLIKTLFQQARVKLYDSGVITDKGSDGIENVGKMPIGNITNADGKRLDQDRIDLKARYDENMALLNKILEGPRAALELHRITQEDAEKVKKHLEKPKKYDPDDMDPRLLVGVNPWG